LTVHDVLMMGAGAASALVLIALAAWSSGNDQADEEDVFVPPHCKGELRMRVQLQVGQFIRLGVTPRTAAGDAAKIDGKPRWAPSTMGVVALHVSKDGMRALAHARGLGSVNIVADVDADMGAGVRLIRTALDIEVVEVEAADLVLDAHVPEDAEDLEAALAELDEQVEEPAAELPAEPVTGTTTTPDPATGSPATVGETGAGETVTPNGADMGAAPTTPDASK
jgi:hypothetical protein